MCLCAHTHVCVCIYFYADINTDTDTNISALLVHTNEYKLHINTPVLIIISYSTGTPTGRAPGALPGSFEAKLHQAMRALAEYGMDPTSV